MNVTVNTHDIQLPYIPHTQADKPLFKTDIFDTQEAGVEELIERVLLDNMPTETHE